MTTGNCEICKWAKKHHKLSLCQINERIPAPTADNPNQTIGGRAYGERDPGNCGRYEKKK